MSKRYRPNHILTIITFFILFVALEFLLWAIFGIRFWRLTDPTYKHDYIVDIIYTSVAFILILTVLIVYIVKTYYVVESKQIIRYGFSMKSYRFNNIVYLDEIYSARHVDMRFYDNSGYWVYLTDTRRKELIKIIKNKCPLLTLEEFKEKYPNVTIEK